MRAYKPYSPVKDRYEVYRFLFPQDRKYKSNISLFSKNGDRMAYLDKVHPAGIATTVANLNLYKELDYYISANTFVQHCGRSKASLFSLNNIVIDLDMHSKDDLQNNSNEQAGVDLLEDVSHNELHWRLHKTEELCHELTWRLMRDLFSDCPPNIIHRTGRGLQLWWHLEETSKELLWLYTDAIKKIILLIDSILQDNPELRHVVVIDDTASKNAAGLFRLFGTVNTKTGRQSRYNILHRNSYNLNNLNGLLDAVSEAQLDSKVEPTLPVKNKYHRKNNDQSNPNTPKHPRTHTAQLKRKWIIEQRVAEMTDHVKWRNKILLVAFHNMRLIAPLEEAQRYCMKLNQSFSEPLPSISHITSREKPYFFRDKTLCEYLGITKEKFDELSKQYYATHRNDARNIHAQARKEEKEQRYAKCQRLRDEGYSVAQIVHMTGVPRNTIYRHTIAPQKSSKQIV